MDNMIPYESLQIPEQYTEFFKTHAEEFKNRVKQLNWNFKTEDIKTFAAQLADDYNPDILKQNTQLLLYRNVFTAIIAALEARDAYTSHHSERVSIMCERFCLAIGLTPPQTMIAEITANVHDIGKIGISDAALKKPGKLDDDEWDEMKTHASLGADIIMKAGSLEFLAEGIRSHHERFDGQGYPDGLKGDEIPYTSRIIAICDSTDAMMSSRCYRKHLTAEVCKTELAKNKGLMYQPELVDIFLANWNLIVGDLYDEYEEKSDIVLTTDRLEIVPLTASQLSLLVDDLPRLESALNCTYNAEPLEGAFLDIVRGQLKATEADPENYAWHSFWLLIRKSDRIVVGSADFKDVPNENHEVEIGYGLGLIYEHLGYMTEAVGAMCAWALAQPGVAHVIAETDLDGLASQHVLARNNFCEYSRAATSWWRL